jgi:hypothetical protein
MTGGNGGANPGRGRVRLLVTLDLPERVRREAESWQQEALTDPALRHNTGLRIVLMFLGHRPQREVGRYLEAIRELCASAPAPLVELGDVVAKGADAGASSRVRPASQVAGGGSPPDRIALGLHQPRALHLRTQGADVLAAPDGRQGADRRSQITPPGDGPEPPGPSDPGGSARSLRGAARRSLSVRNATGRSVTR